MQTSDIEAKIKTDYPDLIGAKRLIGPSGFYTYDIIQFKSFLNKIFPQQDIFVSDDFLAEMKKKLADKYGYDKSCFKTFGSLETISFAKLKYYQLEVGIKGPQYTDLSEPVSIVKYKDLLILENGYHRTLKKIMQGNNLTEAYILPIS